jgi:hypothetical protein
MSSSNITRKRLRIDASGYTARIAARAMPDASIAIRTSFSVMSFPPLDDDAADAPRYDSRDMHPSNDAVLLLGWHDRIGDARASIFPPPPPALALVRRTYPTGRRRLAMRPEEEKAAAVIEDVPAAATTFAMIIARNSPRRSGLRRWVSAGTSLLGILFLLDESKKGRRTDTHTLNLHSTSSQHFTHERDATKGAR